VSSNPIRLGFIGLNPDTHWAATAHIPALAALRDRYEIVGVANSSSESSRRTADVLGLPHAFLTAEDLVSSSNVDMVVVTVKVPHHLELVTAALEAGKHVYCEWPLGNGLNEARQLAALAATKGLSPQSARRRGLRLRSSIFATWSRTVTSGKSGRQHCWVQAAIGRTKPRQTMRTFSMPPTARQCNPSRLRTRSRPSSMCLVRSRTFRLV
jgi:hypothetical protein